MMKVPYMLVLGDKEAATGAVPVRTRSSVDLGAMPIEQFLARVRTEIEGRRDVDLAAGRTK